MAVTIRELADFLDARVPRTLSCAWDNDGLLCCPNPAATVKRVLVALDVTEKTVGMAVSGEYDLLLTHHPLIFRPIKALEPSAVVGRKLLKLAMAGVSAFTLHTRFDALDGGVNDALAAAISLPVVGRFACEEALEGRIVETAGPISLQAFAMQVKQGLGTDAVNCADAGRPVHRIGLLGGEGGDFIRSALESGCDTYLTGRAGYHAMLDAAEMGINVVEAGHFATERPCCAVLAALVREADPTIAVNCFTEPALVTI